MLKRACVVGDRVWSPRFGPGTVAGYTGIPDIEGAVVMLVVFDEPNTELHSGSMFLGDPGRPDRCLWYSWQGTTDCRIGTDELVQEEQGERDA